MCSLSSFSFPFAQTPLPSVDSLLLCTSQLSRIPMLRPIPPTPLYFLTSAPFYSYSSIFQSSSCIFFSSLVCHDIYSSSFSSSSLFGQRPLALLVITDFCSATFGDAHRTSKLSRLWKIMYLKWLGSAWRKRQRKGKNQIADCRTAFFFA